MFQVLHSSAGAGKTHALVKHYLGHCLVVEEPSTYQQVLALTFTNKAAGEMKERVMHYLDDLAELRIADARIADVMDHLVAVSGEDPATIAQRAERCLGHMLHHWGEVAISTIDAFTRKVVRPFARDLQLDHDLRMTTEQDHYLDRAVETLIAEAGVDPAITALLTQACLQLLHEERKWDPEKPLRELAGELVKESAIGPLRELGTFAPEDVHALAARLRTEEIIFRRRMNDLGDEAMRLLNANGLTYNEMANGKGGIYGYFKRLSEFSDVLDAPGVNTIKPIESGKWHSAKADAAAVSALRSISDPLANIFHQAEELRENGMKDYIVQRAVSRELYPAFALQELNNKLEFLKREDGVTFFSDLTRKVSDVVENEPVPFIYERMGERYRHFLIDEFQDTSLLQWRSLMPLIENAIATGGSALLVGDAKQAIYRWRNGEVRLFTSFPILFGNGATPLDAQRQRTIKRTYAEGERLAYNRRSAQAIVAFNNNLFEPLTSVLPEELRNVYMRHEQGTQRTEQGLVHVETLGKDVTGEDRQRAFLDFTLKCVHEALEDGFAPGDIAVLVRGRSLGAPVAAHLVAHGHAVISPDGLRLSGDPVIELLIDLLRFIHTDDIGAAARIVQYRSMLNAATGDAHAFPFRTQGGLPDPVAEMHAWLEQAGSPTLRTTLTALIAQLARANGIAPAEDAPVSALLDEAHAWTTQHGQDISGFLVHWERTGGDRSVAAPENGQAIQVLTVHKSKGLQFPVVIVPNANMGTRGNFGERFWIHPGDAIPELPIALVRESQALRSIAVPELEEEAALRVLDVLDLLYVAFTRPEQRLYALVPRSTPDATTKALLDFIDGNGTDGALMDGLREAPWRMRTAERTKELVDVAGTGAPPPLLVRYEAPNEWEPSDPDPYRSYGTAVHDVLARTNAPHDLEGAINAVLGEGSITSSVASTLHERLPRLIASSDLSPWFGAGIDVRNEITLITPEGQALRPDRVVFAGDRARVLDIKTGAPLPKHHDQVRLYMEHLTALGYAEVEGALLYIADGSVITVQR